MCKKKRKIKSVLLIGFLMPLMAGCSMYGGLKSDSVSDTNESTEISESSNVEVKKIDSLEFVHSLSIEKAEYFDIDVYKDGYYVITTHRNKDVQQLLVVPEGKNVPEGLDSDIIVVKQPVNSSKIDSITLLTLLSDIEGALLNKVSLISYNKDNIFTEKIVNNINSNLIKYAGSESAPDLTTIKAAGLQVYLCNPSLLKEQSYEEIKKMGTTPFVTYLHQESDPLGRIEWAKVLGVIYGDIAGAERFFSEQKTMAESVDKSLAHNATYVMFYLQQKDNKAFVRRTDDAIAKIGEFAGGVNGLSDIHKSSWEEMSIDDFVDKFKDTDYLIYFDKHGDSIESLEQINSTSERIKDLKAVQNGNVWRTRTDYTQMNNIGEMVKELNSIFSQDDGGVESVKEFVRII